MGQRPAAALLLLLALAGISWRTAAAATTFTYTTNATKLAAIWVNPEVFELLGGDRAPKFTGSAISAGIIRWDPNDDHYLKPYNSPVSAVLSTGDAKLSISKDKYSGVERKPTYPDIVNSNIQGSHDAVVLDFWVRAKTSEGGVIGTIEAASNEGSPAAIKIHGTGPRDAFHFEVNGVFQERRTMQKIWNSGIECEDQCKPTPLSAKMHYISTGGYYRETGMPAMKKGKLYRIKVRLADTGDRLVDSALYLNKGRLSAWG